MQIWDSVYVNVVYIDVNIRHEYVNVGCVCLDVENA